MQSSSLARFARLGNSSSHGTARRLLALVVTLLALVACGGGQPAASRPNTLVVATSDGGAAVAVANAPEDDVAIPISSDDAVRGNRLAPVTIVVFSDFQCPFCSRLVPTLDRLREEYGEDKLRIVFKNNPLGFHQYARMAAEIGQGVLALGGQEAFWRYHDMAFRRQSVLSPEAAKSWAVAAGVDEAALDDGMQKKRWSPKVAYDIEVGARVGVQGTPASFVNGIHVSGAQPYEVFKQAVDAEIADAHAAIARGTAPDKVYAQLTAANFKPAPVHAEPEEEPADTQTVFKVPVGNSPTRGPATAQVTIVEFSDFQCPYCKKVEEVIGRIRKEYGDKVRVVWRDRPLPFHPRAEPAAELARFARAQKGDAGFWDVHDRLFESAPKLEDADLERVAEGAKLDAKKAMAAVASKAFKRGIDDDQSIGDDFEASGTPHFFINGRRLVGAQPFEKFKALIDQEVVKADALVQKGTPRTALYDTLIKDGKGPAEPETKSFGAPPANAPFRGAAGAKVVIQQVSDFQCPFCKRVEPTVDELLKAYPGKIKIVWRDKPLPMHVDAPLAAEAAREAYAQKGNDGFFKMHKLLFENQQALKRDDLDGYAKKIGLDMTRFAKALDNHTHRAAVAADEKASDDAGVTGTPSFFIGPYYVSGAQPFNHFKRVVDRALNGPPPSAPIAKPISADATSLGINDLTIGTGRAVKSGDKVKVHYVGTLRDGTEFDQSRKRGQPFGFEVGRGMVIKGWDQGLVGMKVGGKRKLTIPPDLAYGDRGVSGTIPPHATLFFEIELLAIE